MKRVVFFVLSGITSLLAGQAPEIVVRYASGASLGGRVAALYREGAMIEDADGHTTLIRWQDLPSMNPEEPAGVSAAAGTPSGAQPAPVAAGDDAAGKKTPLCPKPLKGKIALSGTVRSGNVDSILGALHAEATKDWEEDKLTAEIDALYGDADHKLTAASIGGKTRLDHFFDQTLYGYASIEALYDKIQHLDLRTILSVGAGDFIWKKSEDCSWSVEGGLSALYEDYSTSDHATLSPAARAATTYRRVLFKDLKFEEKLELLVPLDEPSRYLGRSRTTLGVPLCRNLALRLSLDLTYQHDPPMDTKSLDVLGLVGIEYQF